MHMRPHGGSKHGYIKCFVCEVFLVNSPWGLEVGCNVCRNDPYVTTRKTMITNLCWLNGLLFIFLQLVQFLSCMRKQLWIA